MGARVCGAGDDEGWEDGEPWVMEAAAVVALAEEKDDVVAGVTVDPAATGEDAATAALLALGAVAAAVVTGATEEDVLSSCFNETLGVVFGAAVPAAVAVTVIAVAVAAGATPGVADATVCAAQEEDATTVDASGSAFRGSFWFRALLKEAFWGTAVDGGGGDGEDITMVLLLLFAAGLPALEMVLESDVSCDVTVTIIKLSLSSSPSVLAAAKPTSASIFEGTAIGIVALSAVPSDDDMSMLLSVIITSPLTSEAIATAAASSSSLSRTVLSKNASGANSSDNSFISWSMAALLWAPSPPSRSSFVRLRERDRGDPGDRDSSDTERCCGPIAFVSLSSNDSESSENSPSVMAEMVDRVDTDAERSALLGD